MLTLCIGVLAGLFVGLARPPAGMRTIRPRAFEIGAKRASARVGSAQTGAEVMLALLEGAAERLADVLAEQTKAADALSLHIFDQTETVDLRQSLQDLGRIGAIVALVHDALSSIQRLFVYARAQKNKYGIDPSRVSALARDVGWAASVGDDRPDGLLDL